MDTEPGKAWTPQELVKLGTAEEPYFAPDAGYHYSNTNTVLLGLVAEKLAGQTLQQLFENRIFKPLGMTHTSLPAAADSSIPTPYSHGYLYGTNVSTLDTAVLPKAQQAAAQAGTLTPHNMRRTPTPPGDGRPAASSPRPATLRSMHSTSSAAACWTPPTRRRASTACASSTRATLSAGDTATHCSRSAT